MRGQQHLVGRHDRDSLCKSAAHPGAGRLETADDLNDRVIVVDRKTKAIIWQYGVKGKKGYAPGLLNYPDGADLDVFRDWKSALGK